MQRYDKISKFLLKKRYRTTGKKFAYERRQKIAKKRLRIKGRFVTRPQAFEMLDLEDDEEVTGEML